MHAFSNGFMDGARNSSPCCKEVQSKNGLSKKVIRSSSRIFLGNSKSILLSSEMSIVVFILFLQILLWEIPFLD